MTTQATVEKYWKDGSARGDVLADFLRREVGELRDRRVLDLGCASGGIAMALAEHAASVVGMDLSLPEVHRAGERSRGQTTKVPAFLAAGALHTPFREGSFEFVLLIGVLEYMGRADPGLRPRDAQLRCLQEVLRILNPGGSVIVAIENRWFPPCLLRSPHQGVPGGLLLPHAIAPRIARIWHSEPMWDMIHGYWGLGRLLREAGFGRTSGFLPVYGYQFPKAIVRADDRAGLWRLASRNSRDASTGYDELTTGGRWGPLWFRAITGLGLQKLLAPALLLTATK